jgi:hypothetical protein
MKSSLHRIGVGVVLASLLAPGCSAVDDTASSVEETSSLGTALEAKPGDLVELDRVSVIAPQPGLGVWAEVVLEDGGTRTMRVETRIDGKVWLFTADGEAADHDEASEGTDEGAGAADEITSEAEAAGEATAPGATKPCQDGAKAIAPWTWTTTFDWYFNAGTTPAGLSKDAVETALQKATTNITASRDSCGLADLVSAKHAYQGRTSTATQITASATCKDGNGKSTVGFGDLPQGILGLTCVWFDGNGTAVESDMRLNKGDYKWTASVGASCTNRWSIEAVATHERGHTFGIGHVGEAAHGNLTMSPQLNGPCQNSESTLGLGDVRALRAKY